jgi:pimeloyl-ACP methyl ester carboxylesterase
MRLVSSMASGSLPEPVRSQERAFGSTAGQARSMRDELAALPTLMERAQSLTTVGDKPVAIVTAEQGAMEGWLPLQAQLTELSTNSSQRSVPDATHTSVVEDEHDSANASRAILDVVRDVRAQSSPDVLAVPTQASTPVARPTVAVDELVAVDGARMHVRCSGSGAVTAVLIAGFETSSEIWSAVTPTIAQQTRVCSYDRYGTGTSDPAPRAQTFADQAEDLHAALSSLGETGPYLVVGHSFGGARAVTFAAEYRTEVAGLVLVDASPATWPAAICAVPEDGTPAAAGYQQLCTNISTPANNAERLDGVAAFDEVAGIDSLEDLPMVVMTATRHPWGLAGAENVRLDTAWAAGQEHWRSLSSSARLVPVDDTGHNIQIDRPDAVIEQVQQLLP